MSALMVFEALIVPDLVSQELSASGFLPKIQTALRNRLRLEPTTPEELILVRERCAGFRLQMADLAVVTVALRVPGSSC